MRLPIPANPPHRGREDVPSLRSQTECRSLDRSARQDVRSNGARREPRRWACLFCAAGEADTFQRLHMPVLASRIAQLNLHSAQEEIEPFVLRLRESEYWRRGRSSQREAFLVRAGDLAN